MLLTGRYQRFLSLRVVKRHSQPAAAAAACVAVAADGAATHGKMSWGNGSQAAVIPRAELCLRQAVEELMRQG